LKITCDPARLFVEIFVPDSAVVIDIDGFRLKLVPDPFIQFKEIKINYIPKKFIVEQLKQKIIKNLDGSRTILRISYADKDPEVAAAVINTLTNMYIIRLLDYKRFRTTSVLKSLEEQLDVSRIELDLSEKRLRSFREQNPYLMLSRDGTNIVTQLSGQQSELSNITQSMDQLNYLLQKKNNSTGENRNMVYLEIISTISTNNLAGSQVIFNQYTDLIQERDRLINERYSEEHMLVKDVNSRLNEMQKEIDTRISNYLSQIGDQKNNLNKTVVENEANIRRLPRNEIRLAELQRDRQVKSSIYSNILVRYNEAKVSDASVIPDAYIIEEAQVPIVYSDIKSKLIKLILGPFIGFFFAIGLFIALDFVDKSVKDSLEVEAKLGLPLLATIPIILEDNEIPNEIENHRQLDPKLITSNYAPSLANEKFRLLRTKLFMQQKQNRSYIVTSMTAGDGKSLITANMAITFAQQKISTLLIDCDLRRGVLHNSYKSNKKPGLTDILIKNVPITENDISQVIQNTHIPNLFLISSGIQIPNPSELLGSVRMQQLLELLKKKFSIIVIDTPPIELIPDAMVLNSIVHNILLVVRYGKTNLNKVIDKMTEYSNIKEDFKGVIINASKEAEKEKYKSYSYYHY